MESRKPRAVPADVSSGPAEDGEELMSLAEDLRAGLRHAVYLMRGLDADGEWSTAQVGVLNMLAESPLRMSGIAKRTGIRVPSATDLVTRLENAGLVTRGPDPHDARAVLVRLTDQGRATRSAVNARRDGYLAKLLSRLDRTDREALRQAVPALERLTAPDDGSR